MFDYFQNGNLCSKNTEEYLQEPYDISFRKARCRLAYSTLYNEPVTHLSRDRLESLLNEFRVPLPLEDILAVYDVMSKNGAQNVLMEDFLNEFVKGVARHTM